MPRGPYRFEGRTALITGAASGIGRALAVGLAERGCNLIVTDVNLSGVEETAALARRPGVTVSAERLDVSDPDAIRAMPGKVATAHGGLDLLINNAGVAIGGTFEEVSEADFDWLLSINLLGVVRMTRAFLPMLKASADARLVNLSSLFGLIAPPGQTAYCAAKFGVRGFSHALSAELSGTSVGVTVVHPGGVATNIAKSARGFEHLAPEEVERRLRRVQQHLRMPPARAADIILLGVERRKARVLVGSDAKFLALMERLAPVGYGRLLTRVMGS